jgi:type III secretory pathway component EscR
METVRAIERRLTIGCGLAAIVLAILITGCGDQSSSQRANDKLDALEAKIATQYETAATPYNDYLDKATQKYIALVRRYADQLGPKEARRRLMAEGDEVSSFCPPCAGDLRDAARRY